MYLDHDIFRQGFHYSQSETVGSRSLPELYPTAGQSKILTERQSSSVRAEQALPEVGDSPASPQLAELTERNDDGSETRTWDVLHG